ncbi:MAG: LD-carboxypeptidase [Telluria sp.]
MNFPQIGLAIVAPGGGALDGAQLTRGIERLQEFGCTVHNYYDHDARMQRFAGTDADRLEQLHAAARDPQVQVVMGLRGQYGISRLLDKIDFDLLADSGKIFVGYSDLTALHMGLYARRGVMSYAGPMFYGDFTNDELVPYTVENFAECLRGPTHSVIGYGSGNPDVQVEGTVWGGNLAMLCHLAGTPWFPQIEGGILYVEDVNEHPYRIERMLLQLLHMGVLQKQKALVLGAITAYKLAPSDNGYDFDVMLAYLRERLPIPIFTGLPFGHVAVRATIPFGAPATLASEGSRFVLTMHDYPTLQQA